MNIHKISNLVAGCALVAVLSWSLQASAISPDADAMASVLPSLSHRFAPGADTDETPDFQKHVAPLLGRMGCNGRACHGSFQGRGGFQLSLFGYDFAADHKALLEEASGRVDLNDVDESLILAKPTDEDMHEGGKRFERDGWEYIVLRRWIAAGAVYNKQQPQRLIGLDVSPTEILFNRDSLAVPLSVVAIWDDGKREDVTELCRFHSNDDSIAKIDEAGVVSSANKGDTHVVVSYDNAVIPVLVIRPVTDQSGTNYPNIETSTEVDRLIADKLRKLGIIPSGICTDEEFLRRASLDIAGTLPRAAEVREFLADIDPDKRRRKIDELLASPGYAAWWTTRLCDWSGNSETQLNNVSPIRNAPPQQWYEWIHKRVSENMPYDELVEGIVVAKSREEGESYREYCEAMGDSCRKGAMDGFAERPGLTYYWARRNFKKVEDRAIGFAYTFLGIRIQCAQCHKHPFDQWSKQDFDHFKNLFQTVALSVKPRDASDLQQYDAMMAEFDSGNLKGNQLRKMLQKEFQKGAVIPFPELIERPVRGVPKGKQKKKGNKRQLAQSPTAKLLGGNYVELDSMARHKLMDWLRSPDNPYFAKAIVNRVWANYFGIGIVDPVDDLNLANPPSNAPLMDYLADGLIAGGYDLHWLHRTIVSSDAYQRSWEVNETNMMDKRNFSHFIPRRLPAEVLYDAVLIATANDDDALQLCSRREGRAIGLASSSPRNAGKGSAAYALKVFGRSIRESNCDCDRSEDPNLLQTIYLQNDDDINMRLYSGKGWLAKQMNSLGQPMPQRVQPNVKINQRVIEVRKQQIVKLRQRVDQIKASRAKLGDDEKGWQAAKRKQFEGQLASMNKKLHKLQQEMPGSPRDVSRSQLVGLVNEAYLRIISRRPEDQELDDSIAFIESSKSVAEGVGGVMWALINTKEFVLNH